MSARRRIGYLFAAIAILALAGVIVSAVSLQRHYAKSATQFCDFSQQFSCDIVNRSEYSTIAGNSSGWHRCAGVRCTLLCCRLSGRSRPETPNRLWIASVAGFAFALYLTYVEAHELMTWCILCLMSQLALSF